MVDITDQRRMQEELLQSQKMDSLGRLAGGVAHDFNNLLTVIRGFSDVLSTQFAEEDPRLGEVREIRGAADRATSLTRQLLAVSRRQVLVTREVDLNLLIQEMERMLGRVIGENINVITVPGRDLGWVRADPSQLEQVLLNLAVNARDAMPRGWDADHRDPPPDDRGRPGRASPSRGPARRLRHAQRAGYRHRDGSRDPADDLRAVLHNQAGRRGNRPWPLHGVRYRPAEQRRDHRRERAGQRYRDPHLPSPDPGAGRDPPLAGSSALGPGFQSDSGLHPPGRGR